MMVGFEKNREGGQWPKGRPQLCKEPVHSAKGGLSSWEGEGKRGLVSRLRGNQTGVQLEKSG